ncbi:hypothetical protein PV410_12465 [Streptomyces sp. PA03-5A]|nr:hypothetical protein [Streptomyces sp. PA03-5A]
MTDPYDRIECDTDRGESPFGWSDDTDHPAPDARTVAQIHATADQLDEEAGSGASHPLADRLRGLLRPRRDGER